MTVLQLSQTVFDAWTYALIDQSYDYRQIGISNDHCNSISEPNFGLRLIDWPDRRFYVVNSALYTHFLLKYT